MRSDATFFNINSYLQDNCGSSQREDPPGFLWTRASGVNIDQEHYVGRNKSRTTGNGQAGYVKERKAMMQQWADMVDALAKGAKVIPLQRRAK